MKWRAATFALMISGSVFAQDIHLKTRDLPRGSLPSGALLDSHRIAEFDHPPGDQDLAALAIVNASMTSLQAQAIHDEVAYIFPADPALLTGPSFSGRAGC